MLGVCLCLGCGDVSGEDAGLEHGLEAWGGVMSV